MKADDGQTSPTRKQINGRANETREAAKLIVDENPEGLEGASRGMDSFVTTRMHCPVDYVCQCFCIMNRACCHDCPRDASRAMFFAVGKDQVSQIFFAIVVDHFSGCQVCFAVHPHVEWTFALKTEAAIG